jgi:hypothetical protein
MPAVTKDIAFALKKGTTPFKVVSVLQEQFKTPPSVGEDGKTKEARKPQGRLVVGAVVEAVFEYASPQTLEALADDVKDKGEGEKKGKASEYIRSIVGARAATPGAKKSADDMSPEELRALADQKEQAMKPGGKTTGVKPL